MKQRFVRFLWTAFKNEASVRYTETTGWKEFQKIPLCSKGFLSNRFCLRYNKLSLNIWKFVLRDCIASFGIASLSWRHIVENRKKLRTVGQTKLWCTSLKFIIKVHFLKIYVQYRYLMDKMHSEWSDEFLLSNGNLGAYILAILIDVKILEFQLLSSNTGQGFTKNDLQKRMKAVVCCCFAFFCGVWKTV